VAEADRDLGAKVTQRLYEQGAEQVKEITGQQVQLRQAGSPA
jgi:hypothetical protein